MARIATVNPQAFGFNINDKQDVIVTVTWDTPNEALTANDQYRFSLAPAAGNKGEVTITDPSGGTFPVTVNFVPDPDATKMQATATITVQGKTAGMLTINGASAESSSALPVSCQINVFPQKVALRYVTANFSNPAMRITDKDYDINSAPDDSKSVLMIEAVDADDPNTKVGPFYPVTLQFRNVRETPALITGKFYVNGSPTDLSAASGATEDEDTGEGDTGEGDAEVVDAEGADAASVRVFRAQVPAQTANNSLVTLTVIANNNEGYIDFSSFGGATVTDQAYIYVFNDDLKNVSITDGPVYYGPRDLTNYDKVTVPVGLPSPGPDMGEYLGLFLNGNFEGQTDANAFSDGQDYVITSALTQDLVVDNADDSTDSYNVLYYFLTKSGSLRKSLALTFPVTGTLPPPGPVNPILSNLLQPTGFVINDGSLNGPDRTPRTIDAIMDVKSDVAILADKMMITLSTAQQLRIIVVAQGDYDKTNKYQVDVNSLDTPITADMLASNAVHIPIPREFLNGYGTPPDGSKASKYTIWYGYVNNTTDKNTFASSPAVTGPLSTRI
ncbi:hypothetical protein [Brucella sp. 10RB9213]|uniref:hypothetical protein n=1 Tax=Brucella sp. 10RB9213 TaxID=1844039 RepID=UPI0012AD30C8|nr:hypothetical protein [Brucella sp. 10RB9213]MRN67583.1 hypothetical protein [Brucella sp. 10RB9213]